jgi:hypothetical protein
MRHLETFRPFIFGKIASLFAASWLSFGLVLALSPSLRAENPDSAPAALKDAIAQLETAANQKNLTLVLERYDPGFSTADGLKLETVKTALESFWKSYPDLTYSTQLLSWEKTPEGWAAQTRTTLKGVGNEDERSVKLTSVIESRQYFKDQKLLRQEILSERTTITSGVNPPEVDIQIPTTVKVGKEFDFDIIVKEPLKDDLLAGVAIAEKVDSARYLKSSPLDLELLNAGGLFKRVKAADKPEDDWISAILIRGDGITLVTQRVRVEP